MKRKIIFVSLLVIAVCICFVVFMQTKAIKSPSPKTKVPAENTPSADVVEKDSVVLEKDVPHPGIKQEVLAPEEPQTSSQPEQMSAKVIIKVRAVNPLDKKAVAPLHYPLPKEITPKDVVGHRVVFSETRSEDEMPEISEFQLNYDDGEGVYYIDQEIELLPKEIATLEVSVNDVWVVDQGPIDELRNEIKNLEATMEKDPTQKSDTLVALRDEIVDELDNISRKQSLYAIKNVGIQKHIDIYRDNMQTLEQLFEDVSVMKNLLKTLESPKEEPKEQ